MKCTTQFLLHILLFFVSVPVLSQNIYDGKGNYIDEYGKKHSVKEEFNDSVKKTGIPEGLSVWTVNERFGDIRPAEIDTMPHQFQNKNLTDGEKGTYNFLGNLGSPRLSRQFFCRESRFADFIFSSPLDFFLTEPSAFHFTNTLSPITNITYNECGDRTDGEDHIKALYAINVNKRLGIGFKFDYVYGRGYYNSQSTAFFNSTFYGSYLGEKYQLHASYSGNHMKLAENGGVENDLYITNPESLPSNYESSDYPTRLNKTWNKMNLTTIHLNHRYNIGFHKVTDKDGHTVKRMVIDSTMVLSIIGDSLSLYRAVFDSLLTIKEEREKDFRTSFIPVTSINHVLRINYNTRKFQCNQVAGNYFLNNYYGGDSINDRTRFLHIGNTVALKLHEGFNRWAKASVTLFGAYDLFHFNIPSDRNHFNSYDQNDLTIGARLQRTTGKKFNYDLIAETTTTNGEKWGEFHITGQGNLKIPFKKDSLEIALRGHIRNENPSFYYKHYHSQKVWWDHENLDKQFRTRIEGEFRYSRTNTSLRFGVENIKNYTYFSSIAQLFGEDGADLITYQNGAAVKQHTGNIQVISAVLNQNFKAGILNWENELTYQVTSDKESLPLPSFSAYSNIYLLFRIAKVLRVQFGADVRFFTNYYAPAYCPMIGQFTTQADEDKVKIGNYPIVNAYVNFHLKHTRFYIMGSHINKSSNGGRYFLVPHYPINPFTLRFGLSWNFFN